MGPGGISTVDSKVNGATFEGRIFFPAFLVRSGDLFGALGRGRCWQDGAKTGSQWQVGASR